VTPSVPRPEIVENKSDDRDKAYLANDLRRFANLTYRAQFGVTTKDGTVTQIWLSDDMRSNIVWEVRVTFVALATDGNAGYYQRVARFKRLMGGVAIRSSIALPVADTEDVAGWDVDVVPFANGVKAQVLGNAGRTVNWSAFVEIVEL
jgi:hypothetical protein